MTADHPRPTARCTSCGAIVERPAERIAGACTYCGSQLVDVERGDAEVDAVAPFRLSKAAAQDRLRRHLAQRPWAPEDLRRQAARGRLDDEALRGVLVPFLRYDATCRSRYQGRVGVYWYRKEHRTDRKTGKRVVEVVRETEWFPFSGTAVGELVHLESASAGLSAGEARGLGPFDLGRAVSFDARLVSGWQAELPSRPHATVHRDAVDAIRAIERRRILREHLPGDTHEHMEVDCTVTVRRVALVLLPVWVAAYRHGGKLHRMLVHGQTGLCTGRVPVSRGKIAAAAALVAGLAVLVLWATGVLR